MQQKFLKTAFVAVMVVIMAMSVFAGFGFAEGADKPLFIDAKSGEGFDDVPKLILRIKTDNPNKKIDINDVYKLVMPEGVYVNVVQDYNAQKNAFIKFLQSQGVDLTSPSVSDDIQEAIQKNGEDFQTVMNTVKKNFVSEKGKTLEAVKKLSDNTEEPENPDNTGDSGLNDLYDPEKVLKFVDPVFEEAVRDLYGLSSGPIKWKDIANKKELILSEYDKDAEKIIKHAYLDGKIETMVDLKWFINLETIKFHDSSIKLDLSDLKPLQNLREINLMNLRMTGDLSSLSGLKSLRKIDLTSYKMTGELDDLSELKELRYIKLLGSEEIQGRLSDLSGLTKLQELHLGDRGIRGNLMALKELKNLKRISLDSDKVVGSLEDLSSLEKLEDISIGCEKVVGSLKDLSELENLKSLGLYSNKMIECNLEDLKNLSELEYLDLGGMNVIGNLKGLEGLNKLRDLVLDVVNVTGNLSSLSTLYNLEEIHIRFSDYSDNYSVKHSKVKCSTKSFSGLKKLKKLRLDGITFKCHVRDLKLCRDASALVSRHNGGQDHAFYKYEDGSWYYYSSYSDEWFKYY